MCTHNQYHCVQEPFKDFISPDNSSDEDSGIAASLLFTIKRAYCIKGFHLFIPQPKTSLCILEELNEDTKKTLGKTGNPLYTEPFFYRFHCSQNFTYNTISF